MEKIKEHYVINKNGTIFSKKTGRYLRFSTMKRGYKTISLLLENNKRKTFLVHRLVADKFIPNPKEKEQVNHIDGNKSNNHVSNLEWVTNQENRDHAMANGLIPKTEFEKGFSLGSKNQAAKLNEDLVLEFRKKGLKFREFCNNGLNDTLNLTKGCYNQMMRRYTWKHI